MSGSSMRKYLGVLAAIALCSCSNDWSAGLDDRRAGGQAGSAISSSAGPAGSAAALRAPGDRSFANAPDKGSLVQYPKDEVIRRTGAYTWHAANLSEDHALRSTITGDLSFTAPDGTPIKLAYERHVEHPDGNWSWFGRAQGERGESTVITFGEEAVFGSIPQGSDKPPLRLTIADGRAWVVSADPRQLREIRNAATHPADQDFLVPPKLSAATAAATATATAADAATGGMEAMEAVATTASGKTLVDVMVGFTDGYAAYRGGASAAITRIYNLVEVTNQAYRNSQVNAEVRLVHAMQVSYPDATANKTALEELTGFKAPSTRTTPAPAFSALRSARDQYGADVVVLLRRFQDPESDGCGIAWLIGGGRSGIDASDEFFGYSVVGDGQDAGTDGKTYFCRDETLAHEIGHNMGSQHDADNAKKDDGSVSYGAYSYSFGYRAAAGAGDFYTVMAYGDSGQTRNRVFSNPRIAICGNNAVLACGVTNQADNARSLDLTVPIVASFRQIVVPIPAPAIAQAPFDVNSDGKSDIFLNGGSALAYWAIDGTSRVGDVYLGDAGPGYRLVAFGNFDGAGGADVLWSNGSQLRIWFNDGRARYVVYEMGSYGGGWEPFAAADINGDGKSDILFRGGTALAYWLLDGARVTDSRYGGDGAAGYRVVVSADFNGDGASEVVWSNGSHLKMWVNNGAGQFSPASIGYYTNGWEPFSAGDLDGDRKTDLLFRGGSALAYWKMDGHSVVASRFAGDAGGAFRPFAVADYNGDGVADIGWQNGTQLLQWMNNGVGSYSPSLLGSYICCWQPAGGLP